MTSWILIVVGVLLALVGGLWTLQGLGGLGGSVMSGNATWAVIGPVVLVVGVAVVVIGLRLLRAPSRRRGD
ncbi:hypothetical protein DMB42_09605 [Nonomuraea sp. WAC 01424]|uniref:hypothetical protein n=1 Tax=Nonomuraea sp. WAC 01424 TaxID=2203200 RepID=UPI000F78175A|nr:hypothetical protein [Nonomuraea sp. WAC 01424]RSN12470.1 hypothetical protein DMB42_09605 [Nonomuraea sp. WAC 01424]